jgi:tungstate transport system substrate-binding protein
MISFVALFCLVIGAGCTAKGAEPILPKDRLRVATTTSLYDTGLWGYLEPMFEEEYQDYVVEGEIPHAGVELDVLYAGTGIALEYAKRGDVSVVTVHDKAREEQMVADGYLVERVPFAYNYFLIVGPASDPAGIKGMGPEEAFQKLMETGSGTFVSRGDDSGTHSKEKAIWKAAGFDYEAVTQAGDWYVEAGRGMGATLIMAKELEAYTLTDMGTYVYVNDSAKLGLVPIVDKGAILLNVYSVLAVNPDKVAGVSTEMANNLIDFLTSSRIQELIGDYGVDKYGIQLFTPCAGAEPTG